MSRDQPQRKRGFGDGFAMAFEMVATPLVVAFGGWLIDRWLGTVPVFTLTLGLLALIGKLLAAWYRYTDDMDRHEAELREATRSPGAADATAAGSDPDASVGDAPPEPARSLSGPPDGRLPAGVTLDGPRERGR